MGSRFEMPIFQGFDLNGDPLSGGLLYSFVAGDVAPKALYYDKTLATPASNPVILNSYGYAQNGSAVTTGLYGSGTYKLVLKNSAGVTQWTLDNVSGIGGGEDGDYVSNYGCDLAAAITTIGTTETTLTIDCDIVLTAAVDSPPTLNLRFLRGSVVTLGAYALTIGNMTSPGPFKIFDENSTGAVTFDAGAVDCVLPEWWGAVPDGTTECAAAINSAIASLPSTTYGGTVRFSAGIYAIGTALVRTSNAARLSLVGQGKGITYIKATAAIDMFSYSGASTSSLSGYSKIQGIYFDGDSMAGIGLKFNYANYLRLDDVRVQYCTDEGMYFDDAEDIVMIGVNVFRCGDYATTKPGVGFYHNDGYNNSIQMFGCTFERNRWHSVYAKDTTKLSIHGCKFHGEGTDVTPTEVDLLHLDGCEGFMIIGNQFANSRRWGCYLKPATGGENFDLSGSVIGNRFDANSIGTGPTECGSVYLDTGFAIIDGNQFGGTPNETAPYAGYALIGYDIKVGASAYGAVGTNVATTGGMTRTTEDFLLCSHDAYSPRPMLLARSGKRYHADKWSFATAMTENALEFWSNQAAQVKPRFSIDREGQMTWQGGTSTGPLLTIGLDGTISWGGGAAAVDVVLSRGAANALDLAAGDKLRLDRVKFTPLDTLPASPTTGDVAYDDGTGWSGGAAGLYCYTGAAWVKMT